MRLMATCVLIGLFACVALVRADQAPQQQAPPQFRTAVDLTRIDVTVLDKRTRLPIRGLTADDFVVKLSGQPREVASFAEVEGPQRRIRTVMSGKDPRNTDYRHYRREMCRADLPGLTRVTPNGAAPSGAQRSEHQMGLFGGRTRHGRAPDSLPPRRKPSGSALDPGVWTAPLATMNHCSNSCRATPDWRMMLASVPILISRWSGTGTVVPSVFRCMTM